MSRRVDRPGGILSGQRRPRGVGAVVVAVLAALAGYLLVAQLRGTQSFTQRLAADSQGDLVQILSSLNSEADNLRNEIDNLKLQLLNMKTSSAQDAAAQQQTEQRLANLEVLAGTVPVSGPGVTLSIADPRHQVGYDTMISVVEELRDAGAEAIAIDGRRLSARSWFAQSGVRVTLDGATLATPYQVTAIGDPATLQGGVQIPGGAVDILNSLNGVTTELQENSGLQLAALPSPPTFAAGHPVGSGP